MAELNKNMSREIKFRAWDFDSKSFLKGDFSLGIITGEFRSKYGEVFKNVIIQQFTGLKDKNGIDIYEGDKIKYKNFNGFSKIVFENGSFGYYGASCFITLSETNMEYIEVIGSIHETPELLND